MAVLEGLKFGRQTTSHRTCLDTVTHRF